MSPFPPMDDLAHHCPPNHRKRKTDGDDRTETDAPRHQSRLDTDTAAWSPQVSSPLASARLRTAKRPRIDTNLATKADATNCNGTMYSPIRTPNDLEDIGIVVTTSDPGPSSGSLLRERATAALSPPPIIRKPTSKPQLDFSSPHIPPINPLINRNTLRELDLDVIIRNPVLRHDLLFDAGLQFRPRRKRDLSEKYWSAVWEEVRTGCTCVTLDTHGKLHKTVCVCARCPEPPANPMVVIVSSSGSTYTVRMPSRIPALLAEFLEVMLFVIQPLTNTNVYSNPHDVKEQAREHSAHAAHLREIFDPALIYQELKHKVFDPSGLFQHIGDTLKHHCAPMRDRAVEELVQFAQQAGIEAFKAFRTCLELLELMKLDIANHQLTQLRPWLLRNTGAFEVKAFKMRFGSEPSLHHTREWLHSTHHTLMKKEAYIAYPGSPGDELPYKEMTKNQQIYVSALRGIVDVVFDQWMKSGSSPSPTSSAASSPPETPVVTPRTLTPVVASPSSTSPSTSRPETLYLDKTRLANLSADAADATALYMFMLLFRQLAFAELGPTPFSPVARVDEEDILKLRQELLDIGSAKMGTCFIPISLGSDASEKETREWEQRRSGRLDLVLQVVRRAWELRTRAMPKELTESTSSYDPLGDAPDQRLMNIAIRWIDSNMQPGSPLSVLLHNRMREVLFDLVVTLAFPAKDAGIGAGAGPAFKVSSPSTYTSMPSTPTSPPTSLFSSTIKSHFSSIESSSSLLPASFQPILDLWASTRTLHTAEATTANYQAGMEGVMDDARVLAEKLARLALIHLNTYLGMYESEGFWWHGAVRDSLKMDGEEEV